MKKIVIVKKKNGNTELWKKGKIKKNIEMSLMTLCKNISDISINNVVNSIENELMNKFNEDGKVLELTSMAINDIVMKTLKTFDEDVYNHFKEHKNIMHKYANSFEYIKNETLRIVSTQDTENANKNSDIISTKKELISGVISQEVMLKYMLPRESAKAHEKGFIYIHDLRDLLYKSVNCCIFDLEAVIKGGFTLNNVHIKEPDSFDTFMNLVVDIMLVGSSQQYGGFSIGSIDEIGAPYLKRTYEKELKRLLDIGVTESKAVDEAEKTAWNEALNKMEMFEYKVNCVNNSTGQTPFLSVSFGLGTDKFARMISKAMLEVRMAGMGKNKTTAIFPKLIFLHREDVNGNIKSPNYDIKKMAIKCSANNQYPDWLSLDGKFKGSLGEIYDRCNKVVQMMGCRASLTPWYDENGEEQYTGRFNIGAVSILLARLALESKGDEGKFFELIEDSFEKSLNVLLYRYESLSKQKASSNPLMFTEGGCVVKINPNDTIEKALESATASIGYLGLEEATYYITGKHLCDNIEFGEKVMSKLDNLVEEAKKRTGRLIALYGTPAESLCMTALQQDRNKFGIIEGVTDKEWYTNSFHINVMSEISAIDKINKEFKLYKYSKGGRIMYTEWQHTDNLEALEQYINYCMKLGIYMGINFDNGKCMDCGARNSFVNGECVCCGSEYELLINRVCGYLGLCKVGKSTRYNKGKEEEVKNRFKHYNYVVENCM